MLIAPDTAPRGAGVDGETASWDFGVGAGFYLDATQPVGQHYRMYSYIHELRELVTQELPADAARIGIFGHSMGGHGALTMALKRPGRVPFGVAFAPIAAPSKCPWGEGVHRLSGRRQGAWAQYDASLLMAQAKTPFPAGILIDQGLGDKFLQEQLYPKRLKRPAYRSAAADIASARALRSRLLLHLNLRRRPPALPRAQPYSLISVPSFCRNWAIQPDAQAMPAR
jgi:S-formylglutathione hydrolase